MTLAVRIRCRRTVAGDRAALVRLLAEGFPARTQAWWSTALARLEDHAAALDDPPWGYALEAEGAIVGVLLLIHARGNGRDGGRCNLSSWYVRPAYQAYAPLMVNRATRDAAVTYLNLSPATHTWPIIEAQGFRRYGAGRVLAVPALGRPRPALRVRPFEAEAPERGALLPGEHELLRRHVGYGCVALLVEGPDGVAPFLFLPRRARKVVPSATLVYCRAVEAFVRCAGPLGRALLRRGIPFVRIEAGAPVPGLPGRYLPDAFPRYVKGPGEPRVGDLANTELAMFGP